MLARTIWTITVHTPKWDPLSVGMTMNMPQLARRGDTTVTFIIDTGLSWYMPKQKPSGSAAHKACHRDAPEKYCDDKVMVRNTMKY